MAKSDAAAYTYLQVDHDEEMQPEEIQRPPRQLPFGKLTVFAMGLVVLCVIVIASPRHSPSEQNVTDKNFIQKSGLPSVDDMKKTTGSAVKSVNGVARKKAAEAISRAIVTARDAAMKVARTEINKAVDAAVDQAIDGAKPSIKAAVENVVKAARDGDLKKGANTALKAPFDSIKKGASKAVHAAAQKALATAKPTITKALDDAGQKAINAADKSPLKGVSAIVTQQTATLKANITSDLDKLAKSAVDDAEKDIDVEIKAEAKEAMRAILSQSEPASKATGDSDDKKTPKPTRGPITLIDDEDMMELVER